MKPPVCDKCGKTCKQVTHGYRIVGNRVQGERIWRNRVLCAECLKEVEDKIMPEVVKLG